MTSAEDAVGDIYAHRSIHQAELQQRFPRQFDCPALERVWPYGWHPIVVRVCAAVDVSGHDLRWEQIKEKYGGLRMYWAGQPLRVDMTVKDGSLVTFHVGEADKALDGIRETIRQAELESAQTCSRCSSPASKVEVDGWLTTACATCIPLITAHRRRLATEG